MKRKHYDNIIIQMYIYKDKMSLATELANAAREMNQNNMELNNILKQLSDTIINTIKKHECIWTNNFQNVHVSVDIDFPRKLNILITPNGMEYEDSMIIFNPEHVLKLEDILKDTGFSIKKIEVVTRKKIKIFLSVS